MTPTILAPKLKVCAVSYLNTVPLVWGMLHGSQKGLFDLTFRVPAACADLVAAGQADIGIIPSYELSRHKLGIVSGLGIACRGPVRSILLVSKTPPEAIRTLAADSSSRTSVELARVILSRRYGAEPRIHRHAPDLGNMLGHADAALIIGDPALRLTPESLPFRVYDLGQEWMELTGLPMVFAVWAGPHQCLTPAVAEAFRESCRWGLEHIEDIVKTEAAPRGFPSELVRRYLTEHVVYELGLREYEGLETYLRYAGGEGRNAGDRGKADPKAGLTPQIRL
ncbi:MAG TPA: menaquinone biosynthesis protein [Bryobacteraceae bacterium]|nr:menaquinone biosynthesis protein [Bryobacteraceae bacterium]